MHKQAAAEHRQARIETDAAFIAMAQAQEQHRMNPSETTLQIWNEKKAAFNAISAIRVAKYQRFVKIDKACTVERKKQYRAQQESN